MDSIPRQPHSEIALLAFAGLVVVDHHGVSLSHIGLTGSGAGFQRPRSGPCHGLACPDRVQRLQAAAHCDDFEDGVNGAELLKAIGRRYYCVYIANS